MRYKNKLSAKTSKTQGGREEYQKSYLRSLEISRKEQEETKLKLMSYMAKEHKHKEAYEDMQRKKKWDMLQKNQKREDKFKNVERNLGEQERRHQRSVQKIRKKLLKNPRATTSANETLDLKRAKESLRIKQVEINKERAKRQLEYKKYKVLVKHVSALRSRMQSKKEQDIETQRRSYETYQDNLKLMQAQQKMNRAVMKAQVNSKSMKKLLSKADVKDQVVVKKHLQEEGEGEGEYY